MYTTPLTSLKEGLKGYNYTDEIFGGTQRQEL